MTPDPLSGETELSRELGVTAVASTATGTMIGAGIFVLPGVAAANAGPAAALSFLIAGVIAAMSTFSAAELSTAMPKAGGSYYFVSRAMGPLIGTVVGLGAWLSLVLKGSFALVGLGQYVIFFSPVPVFITALVGGTALILINWLGAKVSGMVQNVVVVLLLAIMGVFVARGLFAVDRSLLTPFFHFHWSSVTLTTGIVFISYLGIVKATAIAEEVKDPGRDIPLGMLISVALVTGLYVLVMLIVTGTLPIAGIGDRAAPLADSGTIFLGAIGGTVVAVAGILATTSTGNAAVLSSARFPFAMARDGLMNPKLNQISKRFKTPSRAIWLTGLIMLALVVAFDVEALAKLGGTFGILVFAALNVSVILLRRANPPWYQPAYTAPLYPWMQIVGTVACLALIPQMGALSQISAVVFIAMGVGWYLWQASKAEAVTPDYGLADQLRRVRHVKSIEEKREALEQPQQADTPAPEPELDQPKIVVELVQGKPNKQLLLLAAALARKHEARVEAVMVSEIPHQVPLSGHKSALDPEWTVKILSRLAEHDITTDLHHIVTHDRDRALLARIDEHTMLALIDWHGPFRLHRLRESHVDTVLRKAPTQVAIFKHRGVQEVANIVVATGGGPYERAEVETADAIASLAGARVTFVKVLPPDAPDERVRNAQAYLHELGELVDAPAQVQLMRSEDVASALVEASREADLLILGASEQARVGRTLFGDLTDRVAARTDASVLIVRGDRGRKPWHQSLLDRFLGGGG